MSLLTKTEDEVEVEGTDNVRFLSLVRPTVDISEALRRSFKGVDIPGVADVRWLPRQSLGSEYHKVFVVLNTHDVERDRRIIDLMGQFEDIAFDIVPAESADMIPDAARSVF